MLSLPISRFGSQIIQPLFHLLVFFVTLLHLSLAPLYLATATSLSLSFPLSLTPPLFRLCPPFLPPTPLCRCASCVMSQGLISGGQPLSRWQPEQQLPGGWARGWWWWGGWLQCCCISRWKWARRKENQLSAACYVLPVWATVWHTQAAFSAVRFLLCCRGCCVCDCFRFVESPLENTTASGSGNDILAFPSDILLPRQPGGNSLSGDCRHMWKRQQSKCVQCRVKRTCYATTWAMSGKGNTTSHNICFWNKSLTCHNPNLLCLHSWIWSRALQFTSWFFSVCIHSVALSERPSQGKNS